MFTHFIFRYDISILIGVESTAASTTRRVRGGTPFGVLRNGEKETKNECDDSETETEVPRSRLDIQFIFAHIFVVLLKWVGR